MGRDKIEENVLRRLYAESLGRCMNPACCAELFRNGGDIIERAHIVPYCKTADNSFENLVLLCPSCHTNFDKNKAFSEEEVKHWKQTRATEIESLFCVKFKSFKDMQRVIVPLLLENKALYEYYMKNHKVLWDSAEPQILVNNYKLRQIFVNNLNLFQDSPYQGFSNLEIIRNFIAHVDEFERTRGNTEKIREFLFPKEIASLFGIEPDKSQSITYSTSTLEALINSLKNKNLYVDLIVGIDDPYLVMMEDGIKKKVYLNDTAYIRQLYFDHNSFRKQTVRIDSWNFALKYMKSRNISYSFKSQMDLTTLMVKGEEITFVYEYCLSKSYLISNVPNDGSIIVNLHNWNGDSCISQEAYELAKSMNVRLLTMKEFYRYVSKK